MKKWLLVAVLFFVPPSFAQAPAEAELFTMTGAERAAIVQMLVGQQRQLDEMEDALEKAAKVISKLRASTGCS